MKKMCMLFLMLFALIMSTGCQRIETGEVGVRINASKEIQGQELMPGSWNQTIIGGVLTFPTKDIQISLENKTPMTSDNSALDDFDINVVYAINPASVAELYSTKSRSFNGIGNGDIFLMYKYIETLVNNASYKSVREYKSLEVADKRAEIELKIRDMVTEQLKIEKLDTAISITLVQIRNVAPNKEILMSATAYVKAQNDLKIKQTEVDIAKKESERMAALSNNSEKSIAYMNAQATLNISEGIKDGKVQTIVVPSNMTGLMIQK
ncbi:SPFH domain-containing protein [Candidatus Dojkabacteria bacterium]|nr:SPFH domain-containing protein [Candidatus Dojkabacteria bacterium]